MNLEAVLIEAAFSFSVLIVGRVFFQNVRWLGLSAMALGLAACLNPQKPSPNVLERVQDQLCDKQVVLLGESGTHGDGATESFKAELIPKLVEDCGFNLILFESSFYEFAKINLDLDQGRKINSLNMANAIGGLWNTDEEVQSLLSFLTDYANAGVLRVAGIDDQLSGRGQDYANLQMPKDVVQGLALSMAAECQQTLSQRIFSDFPEVAPYSEVDKQKLLSCFSIPSDDPYIHGMRSSVRRYIARDFDRKNYFAGRAKSMFENFEFWFDGRDAPKTIIWTATVHAAKARGSLSGGPNTGTYIRQRFGDQSFVLGFSALGGQYRRMAGKVLNVPKAPENSIEFQTMSETERDIIFLNQKELMKFGKSPASIYSYKYVNDQWSDILDGLVIFREQRPTTIIESN